MLRPHRIILVLVSLFFVVFIFITAFPVWYEGDIYQFDIMSAPKFVVSMLDFLSGIGRYVLNYSFKIVKPVAGLLDGENTYIEFLNVGIRSLPVIGQAYDLIYNGIGEFVSWLDSIFNF